MKIKAVLFDLDGTLLPMEQEQFFREYFKLLATKLYPYGYDDPKKLVKVIWAGVTAVEQSDGSRVNEEVFWDCFNKGFPEKTDDKIGVLREFYLNEFQQLKDVCGYNPEADKAVKEIKKKGLVTVVATKPIFPDEANLSRMAWAGVNADDFEYYTSYDKCCFCKPDVRYYKEIAEKLGVLPEECLMVGNDVSDDMTAEKIGMKVFLLTDCLINSENKNISCYKSGSFADLLDYVDILI
ncbi:MAG: HAD family hydrolase [Clostridia bacterium]|nr:HAD family hydrolase [Clostridia bacterium]